MPGTNAVVAIANRPGPLGAADAAATPLAASPRSLQLQRFSLTARAHPLVREFASARGDAMAFALQLGTFAEAPPPLRLFIIMPFRLAGYNGHIVAGRPLLN